MLKRINISKLKKILVVGLGMSGLEVSNFLASKGVDVFVSDKKNEAELADYIKKLDAKVTCIAGNQAPEILDRRFDAVILSPGVPKKIPLISEAYKRRIPVLSEIELAFQYLKGRTIAITGTDGKSTTTALTGHIGNELGYKYFVGGNIGIPFISFVEKSSEDSVTVLELSSFQLETIETFKPDVAAILNITPDHLDRYDSMNDYLEAKFRIAMNQDGNDYFIYNNDDDKIKSNLKKVKAKCLSFSLTDKMSDIYYDKNMLYLRHDGDVCKVLDTEKMRIMGMHNIQNAMASILMTIAVLKKMNMVPDYEKMASSIYSFPGLKHRMEKIGEFEGRIFINDSKATTIGAVEMAVKSLAGDGILILGGRTKGDDYSRLSNILHNKVKGLVLIGESKESFSKIFYNFKHESAETLDDAVVKAMKMSSRGDSIILSPACASFDMFKNYEERGEIFKRSFLKLSNGELSWI